MIKDIIFRTKQASIELMDAKEDKKNSALENIAKAIISHKQAILEANKIDLDNNKDKISDVMYKRLELTEKKIDSIVTGVYDVIALPDPVFEVLEDYVVPPNLRIVKERVPFGLIGVIYEARPNVTVDIAVLALKTGNACILKGGSEAKTTSSLLVKIMKEAIEPFFNPDVLNYVDKREDTIEVLTNQNIDLLIPRGSKNLIRYVLDNAKVNVIETGAGVCHIYVDEYADDEMALKVIMNAKLSNPAVCNAVETILFNKKKEYLIKELANRMPNVIYRSFDELKDIKFEKMTSMDEYNTEYNDLVLSIKLVDDTNTAIKHIAAYSTHHSDSIITSDKKNIELFMNKVDSACVYVNASTRFTDGGCFGFGAEVGISTSKLHARGPMGLKELTTYKYKVYGHGEVRE